VEFVRFSARNRSPFSIPTLKGVNIQQISLVSS
jgi:hypothetical protein